MAIVSRAAPETLSILQLNRGGRREKHQSQSAVSTIEASSASAIPPNHPFLPILARHNNKIPPPLRSENSNTQCKKWCNLIWRKQHRFTTRDSVPRPELWPFKMGNCISVSRKRDAAALTCAIAITPASHILHISSSLYSSTYEPSEGESEAHLAADK